MFAQRLFDDGRASESWSWGREEWSDCVGSSVGDEDRRRVIFVLNGHS